MSVEIGKTLTNLMNIWWGTINLTVKAPFGMGDEEKNNWKLKFACACIDVHSDEAIVKGL